MLFWPRGTSRPSSTSSSGTPRRRPRVMKPRPPQSKHASSLPLLAPLARSLAELPPSVSREALACASMHFFMVPSHAACEITLRKLYRNSAARVTGKFHEERGAETGLMEECVPDNVTERINVILLFSEYILYEYILILSCLVYSTLFVRINSKLQRKIQLIIT